MAHFMVACLCTILVGSLSAATSDTNICENGQDSCEVVLLQTTLDVEDDVNDDGATYVYKSVPVTSPTRNVATLDSTDWPQDYCVDFDITLPKSKNNNQYGYEGTIAMLGQVDIVVTHSAKLPESISPGDGFGFMAIEQSNGNGPYFVTPAVGALGTRHSVSFCYKETTNVPMWIVNGDVQGEYLHNEGVPYPTDRKVPLSLFTGSHSSDTVEALSGATLHSFQIRKDKKPTKDECAKWCYSKKHKSKDWAGEKCSWSSCKGCSECKS
jgi:hypothetical protein